MIIILGHGGGRQEGSRVENGRWGGFGFLLQGETIFDPWGVSVKLLKSAPKQALSEGA